MKFILKVLCLVFCVSPLFAQSTNQSFPTPVTSNEINGKIPARDIGDARLTDYFYVFNGNQGDVFINVVTKNFDGDIDIFTVNGLRPLTKITVYSDSSDNETGRIVYLRQPEKLLLRIEGRTPNDDPATFRIKFAGSFEPIKNVAENEEQEMPEIKTDEGEVRVNSVGTIIEKKPKPTPQVKEAVAEKSDNEEDKKEDKKAEKSDKKEIVVEKKDDEIAEKEEEKKTEEVAEEEEKKDEKKDEKKAAKTKEKSAPVVVITDNLPKSEEKKAEKKEEETASKTETQTKKKPKKPDPLENIKLIVIFKDGTKIERPISEVVRVSVDKGILTIITKDGLISRYSILDVAEMTIK